MRMMAVVAVAEEVRPKTEVAAAVQVQHPKMPAVVVAVVVVATRHVVEEEELLRRRVVVEEVVHRIDREARRSARRTGPGGKRSGRRRPAVAGRGTDGRPRARGAPSGEGAARAATAGGWARCGTQGGARSGSGPSPS